MEKRAQARFEAKTREWEEDMRVFYKTGFGVFITKLAKESKIIYKKYIMNWYFFYQPKGKGDKAWHVICVLIVDLFLLRFFGLI